MEFDYNVDPDESQQGCHDCESWKEYIDTTNDELAKLRGYEQKTPEDRKRIAELEERLHSFVLCQMEHQREAH